MKKTNNRTVFEESNLIFSFDNQWIVHKFDDHRFYKQLAGRNVKGVDFIGIFQEKKLVLMEVKNYIDRYFKDDINPSENFLNNQEFYLTKIAKKYVDSLRVIEAVQQAYRRKWWYQLAEKTMFRWIKIERLPNWEFVFWKKAWELVQTGNLRLILWIEIEKGEGVILNVEQGDLPVLVEIMNQGEHSFEGSLNVDFG